MTEDNLTSTIYNYFTEVEFDRPVDPEWVVEQLRVLYQIEVDAESVEAALPLYRRVEFGPNIAQALLHQR